MGTLSEDQSMMDLAGYVRVANRSGEDYEDARTRLIVGKVHILEEIATLATRQYPYGRPIEMEDDKSVVAGARYRDEIRGKKLGIAGEVVRRMRKQIVKEGLSEYFLYTIEGTETIENGWAKRLLSFEAKDIPVKSLYKYDEQRWGKQTVRYVAFANDKKHNLGDTPIPDGTVKIYSLADEQGHLSYIGGTGIKYIPVDEEVELNLGPARLVKVAPRLMSFETDNFVFNRKGNISGWDEIRSWQIEITNAGSQPVEVEITRWFGTSYWDIRPDGADVSYEKYDAAHARFKAKVGPRDKQKFDYTVTTYHGQRRDALRKKVD